MHDEIWVALISTIGSIIVAYITTQRRDQPTENDCLRRDNAKLRKEIKELKKDENTK